MASQQIQFDFESEITSTNTSANRSSLEETLLGDSRKEGVGVDARLGSSHHDTAHHSSLAVSSFDAVDDLEHQTMNTNERGDFDANPSNSNPDPIAGKQEQKTVRVSLLDQLRQQTGCIQHAGESSEVTTFSTGVAGLDHWLPVGGLKHNAITEWVSEYRGSGATTLAYLAAVSRLNASGGSVGPLVVVSEGESFYPPSAIAFGIPAHRILWVRTRGRKERIWAVDQALRCKSIAAVLALLPSDLDDRDARRFQLASEEGKTPGFFVRPRVARGQPCFAEVRFHVDCCQRKIGKAARFHACDSRAESKDDSLPEESMNSTSKTKSSKPFRLRSGQGVRRSRVTEQEFPSTRQVPLTRDVPLRKGEPMDCVDGVGHNLTRRDRLLNRSGLRSPTSFMRQFQITLDRCRGGQVGRQGRFEMNDFGKVREVVFEEKSAVNHGKTTVHLVSELAHPENSKSKSSIVNCAG